MTDQPTPSDLERARQLAGADTPAPLDDVRDRIAAIRPDVEAAFDRASGLAAAAAAASDSLAGWRDALARAEQAHQGRVAAARSEADERAVTLGTYGDGPMTFTAPQAGTYTVTARTDYLRDEITYTIDPPPWTTSATTVTVTGEDLAADPAAVSARVLAAARAATATEFDHLWRERHGT